MTVLVGISTKAYLSRRATLEWMDGVAELASRHEATRRGLVDVVVAPPTPLLEAAVRAFAGTGVDVMAQDVSRYAGGAVTGESVASLIADVGVRYVEAGHAERRRLFADTDDVLAEKIARTREVGLIPWFCFGEDEVISVPDAVEHCVRQLRVALTAGPLVLAYEPVWAIGADEPASSERVTAVIEGVRAQLPVEAADVGIVYGGSAGPGLLASLSPAADGLFLGRRAHDVAAVEAVLDEALVVASSTAGDGTT